ncbi:hypothetical protein JL722_15059 [Aureococcus anophagefferens]|nr:hypothetical protein JL722_15059 [Aureococcus anophagefferens]
MLRAVIAAFLAATTSGDVAELCAAQASGRPREAGPGAAVQLAESLPGLAALRRLASDVVGAATVEADGAVAFELAPCGNNATFRRSLSVFLSFYSADRAALRRAKCKTPRLQKSCDELARVPAAPRRIAAPAALAADAAADAPQCRDGAARDGHWRRFARGDVGPGYTGSPWDALVARLLRGLYATTVRLLGGAASDDKLKAREDAARGKGGKRASNDPASRTSFDLGGARLAYASMWSDAELGAVKAAVGRAAARGQPFARVVVVANWGAEHSVAAACDRVEAKFARQANRARDAVAAALPGTRPARFDDATLDGVHYGQTAATMGATVLLNMLAAGP